MPNAYTTSKLAYQLPVPDEIQKAIIGQMWPLELENALRNVLNFPERDYFNEKNNIEVDDQYFTSSAEKHWKNRKQLLSGGWKTSASDNRPPYIHQIPQYGDSDVVETLRGWEIPKIEKSEPGKYLLGTGEVYIPKYNEYPELLVGCTKIVVQAGPFNGGYAVLAIPDKEKVTPRLKVTLNAIGLKGMKTDYYSLNQIRRDTEKYWRQVPPDISEGLVKTLAVAREVLGYVPDVELPELQMPETFTPEAEPYPHSISSFFFNEHIPKNFSELKNIEEKEKFDFGNAIMALLRMERGDLPEDNFMKHIIYSYLSEPETLKKLKFKIYNGMNKIVGKLDTVSPYCDINEEDVGIKLTSQEIDEIYKTARTIHPFILIDNLYLPPYMNLTLGEERAQDIINSFALKEFPGAEEAEGGLLKYYKSHDNRLRVCILYGAVDTINGPVELQKFWQKNYEKHFTSILRIIRHKENQKGAAEIVAEE